MSGPPLRLELRIFRFDPRRRRGALFDRTLPENQMAVRRWEDLNDPIELVVFLVATKTFKTLAVVVALVAAASNFFLIGKVLIYSCVIVKDMAFGGIAGFERHVIAAVCGEPVPALGLLFLGGVVIYLCLLLQERIDDMRDHNEMLIDEVRILRHRAVTQSPPARTAPHRRRSPRLQQ